MVKAQPDVGVGEGAHPGSRGWTGVQTQLTRGIFSFQTALFPQLNYLDFTLVLFLFLTFYVFSFELGR